MHFHIYSAIGIINFNLRLKNLVFKIRSSRFSNDFIFFLKRKGYLSYRIDNGFLVITLNSVANRGLLNVIQLRSKPNKRIYFKLSRSKSYCSRQSGAVEVFLTSKGFLTSSECIAGAISGEFFCSLL